MARSRSVSVPSSGGCGGSHARRAGQLAQPGDAGRRALEEQHVAGEQDLVAVDVGDPVALAADGHHAHADVGRAARGRRAAGGPCASRRAPARGATPPRPSDRSATSSRGMPRRWVTMRAMSTAALPMRSMAPMTWSTDAMASASRGRAGGQHAHGAHVVHQLGHAAPRARRPPRPCPGRRSRARRRPGRPSARRCPSPPRASSAGCVVARRSPVATSVPGVGAAA